MKPDRHRSTTPAHNALGFLLAAFGAALIQWHLIVVVMGGNYGRSVEAAQGVLQGGPHWRVYQNRLLGPQLVEWISGVTGSFLTAHILFTVSMLTLAGFLVLAFTRRNTGNMAHALAGFGIFHLLIAVLLYEPWLYAWDHLGLVLFVIFNQLVIGRAATRWFVLLWMFAILNRESAHFIALWLILEPALPFAWARLHGGAPRLDRTRVALGAGLLGGGVLLVEQLREHLLVREIAPELWGLSTEGGAVHFRLLENLETMGRIVTSPDIQMLHVVPALMAGTLLLSLLLVRRDPPLYLGLAAVHVAMLAAIILFGLVAETRIFLEVVPFLAMNLWALVPAVARKEEIIP
jgi:hypothetical protein